MNENSSYCADEASNKEIMRQPGTKYVKKRIQWTQEEVSPNAFKSFNIRLSFRTSNLANLLKSTEPMHGTAFVR